MGGKPRAKAQPESTLINVNDIAQMKELVSEMAGILILCLRHAKFGDGMVFAPDTGEITRIEEMAFDSLDKIGHIIDRENYYADKAKGKRRR